MSIPARAPTLYASRRLLGDGGMQREEGGCLGAGLAVFAPAAVSGIILVIHRLFHRLFCLAVVYVPHPYSPPRPPPPRPGNHRLHTSTLKESLRLPALEGGQSTTGFLGSLALERRLWMSSKQHERADQFHSCEVTMELPIACASLLRLPLMIILNKLWA